MAEATAKLQAPFEADGPVNKRSVNAAFLMLNAAKEISKQADEKMEVINKKTSGPGQKTGGRSCFNAHVQPKVPKPNPFHGITYLFKSIPFSRYFRTNFHEN